MKSSLILIAALLATGAQDKTYDLKLESKPVKGRKAELLDSSAMKMTMKLTGLPEAMTMAEETSYAAAEEILSAEADGSSVRSWKFSKAAKLKDGQSAPLSAEDLSALKKAFMGGDEKPGEPSGADMFAPKKPVKVGEAWTPDIKTLVHGMFEPEMSESVILEKSKCTFTLKSVDNRAGADFGKIDGTMEVVLGMLGPMKLDVPVTLKMNMDLDVCIDGKSPDGLMKLKAEMKGKSAAAGPNGKVEIDLDMTMTGQMSVKSLK